MIPNPPLDEVDDDSELSDDLGAESEPEESHDQTGTDTAELSRSHNKGHGSSSIDEDVDQSQPKKRKLEETQLFIPPTNEELRQLKEAENLFHSSLFKLQMNELLKEVKLKESKRRNVEISLHQLRQVIINLKTGEDHELCKQKWLRKQKVRVPLIQQPMEVKGRFCFHPPSDIKVTGSFILGTCVKPDVHVDLALVMPKTCFQPKDHLNQRYLRKRALYLACVASQLKSCDLIQDLKFSYHNGNLYRPIVILQIKVDSGKTMMIRLHAIPETGIFKLNRFSLSKNNVRQQWFYDQAQTANTPDDDTAVPTPHYNTAILQDVTMTTQLEMMHRSQADCPGVKDGLCLLKVWLRQRELHLGYGGFTGFIMSMYVAYLLSRKKLNKMMSSYQVMRNTLLQLSQSDWTTEPITLRPDLDDPHCPMPAEFQEHFDVVFIDSTGYVNLCADMTTDIFYRVKHEAKLSLETLENKNVNGFEMLFMKPVQFLQKFDHLFHLRDLNSLSQSVGKLKVERKHMDLAGNHVNACLSSILDLLRKALGERVHLLQVKGQEPPQWDVTKSPPQCDSGDKLTFGLLLNPEFSSRVLERGPAADSIEAKEFRAFWGDKSELRRFQDGGICEAVVWSGQTIARKRLICAKIIRHVLHMHAGIPKEKLTYIGGQLETLLMVPLSEKSSDQPCHTTTGEEEHVTMFTAYNALCKVIRGFQDLPLTINAIQGTSPAFRFAEVFPAVPHVTQEKIVTVDGNRCVPVPGKSTPTWTPSMNVVCVLEGSGKWPEDREAFRRLKAAFHIKLGELLRQHDLLIKILPESVHVLKGGYVFALKLAYMHEVSILKMVKTPDGMLQMRDTAESQTLEREIVLLPKLTSTLHGVQQQNNTFSSVVRLAKRWVAAHLLSDYMEAEAIELIVAHLYLCPFPYSYPSSPISGFLRFLNLLATFDWKLNPLLVNFNGAFSKEDFAAIPSHFTKERSKLPLMCIFTPQDKYGSVWTSQNPSAPILHRMALLARESLQVLQQQLLDQPSPTDLKQIFRPPLDVYDVIIHLRPKHVPRQHQAVDLTPDTFVPTPRAAQAEETSTCIPVTDFDPVRFYVNELQEMYGDIALFFHDQYGGSIVAVLWKPQAFQAQPFKVTQLNGRMVDTMSQSSKEVKTIPNVEAIMEDFRVLGGGLVGHIESRTEKWSI